MRLATVQKRNAFTLVELLVVIAIIVILMALTVGVISKVYVYLDEVKVTSDVNRMAQACEQFKSTFGRYPPAKIMLCENPAAYNSFAAGTAQALLAGYSAEYLSSAFPGLLTSGNRINWAALSAFNPATSNNIYVLEGQESLVYFLGGVRSPNGSGALLGFNTDKSRLTALTTGTRLGPFFEFEPSRLVASTNPLSGGFFQNYRDVYGTPYAYYATRGPGMNNYFHPVAPQLINNPVTGMPFTPADILFLSDCPTITVAPSGNRWFSPLWQDFVNGAAIKYHKADTYQIISAGKDKLFGTGGKWNQQDPETSTFGYMNFPANAIDPASPVADVQATYDNITNVTGGRVVPK